MKHLRPLVWSVIFLFSGIFLATAQERLPQFLQHKVKPGETINAIAEQYHVALEDLLLLNDFPPDVTVKTNQVILIRLLNEGEQASPLAADYKEVKSSSPTEHKTAEVAQENEAPEVEKKTVSGEEHYTAPKPETVGPDGTRYKVTESDYHVVQKGQTFYRIALIYGLSVDELKALNNLSSTTIAVGQKLRVKK